MGNFFCFVQVNQSTVAITETFGKFDKVLEPGCHCVPWVFGSQVAGHLPLGVQQLDVKCEIKTKDNFFVNVGATVQYSVVAHQAYDAFYKVSDIRLYIQDYVFYVIGVCVPKLSLDEVFEQKNEIAKTLEKQLEKVTSAYGYQIIHASIVDVDGYESLKKAINDINAAVRMRLAAAAEGETGNILQSMYDRGNACQQLAILDILSDRVLAVRGRTSKDMILDTMKETDVASESSAVLVACNPRAICHVATQIPH